MPGNVLILVPEPLVLPLLLLETLDQLVEVLVVLGSGPLEGARVVEV